MVPHTDKKIETLTPAIQVSLPFNFMEIPLKDISLFFLTILGQLRYFYYIYIQAEH